MSKKKILYVIDPGHYTGYNKGAVKGYYEGDKMQVLAAAQKKYLEQYGIKVILTKNSAKENVDLLERGKVAVTNGKGYDVVIFESVHTNAPGANADKEKVYGATAITTLFLPDSKPFVTAVLNSVVNTMKKGTGITYSRGVTTRVSDYKYDWYGVLQGAMQRATSVEQAKKGPVTCAFITEHGFHSNTVECTWLNNESNLDLLAKNKAATIAEWFGLTVTDADPEDEAATCIMGKPTCTAEQMTAFLKSKTIAKPTVFETYKDIAKIFLEEGLAEGVRGDVAFAQSCHETGNFCFGGDVVPEQNNFAGIGATGGGTKGAYFKDVREGVRAQIQHLKAYASKEKLVNDCVDPRFKLVTRGVAPMVEDLGGRWAYPGYDKKKYKSLDEAKKANDSYGHKILNILKAIEFTRITTPSTPKQDETVTMLYKVGTDWGAGMCIGQVGAYKILDNAIAAAKKDAKLKVFLSGEQIYPPVVASNDFTVAKEYSGGKYIGVIAIADNLMNAIKDYKSGYVIFNKKNEAVYPTFKNITITHKPGVVRIIKDGDAGEGIELHYTPEYTNANLDKVHGPAHLGDVYEVIGEVKYGNNTMNLLANGSYITTSSTYVEFTNKASK